LTQLARHAVRHADARQTVPPAPLSVPHARRQGERPGVSQLLRHHDYGRPENGRGRRRTAHGCRMIWTRKKVLVTGAGGFIGSHLCEELIGTGAAVTALIHYSSRSDWGALG